MLRVTRREFMAGSAAVLASGTTGVHRGGRIRRLRPDAGSRGHAIVHTNDTHGYDVKDDASMGLAAVGALRDSLESQGYEVLVLDAGDAFQGDTFANYSKGESAIALMNEVGYDAMALGNHDFDFGQDVIAERTSEASFPLLSANVVRKKSGEPVFEPRVTLKLRSGLKVGVFGLTTPETQSKTAKRYTVGLSFLEGPELYAAAQEQADLLRADGCDLVVMLAHLGEAEESAPNRACDVIAHVTGVDIVIDGHDHEEEQHTLADAAGADVLVVETGCYTHALGLITYEDGILASTLLGPDSFAGEDSMVAALAASFQQEIDKQLGQTIATTPYFLSGERRPGVRDHETNLGDLIADSFLWAAHTAGETGVSCAIMNGGGIRMSIEAGDITMNSILSVQPFLNPVVTIQVPGSALLEAIEAASQACPDELGGFAQVAGITYEIDTRVPFEAGELYPESTYHAPARPGSRVTIHTVGGESFDEAATYTVVTIDFDATGGDTYYVFSKYADTILDTGVLDYQAMSGYITDAMGGVVSADYADENGGGRITVIE